MDRNWVGHRGHAVGCWKGSFSVGRPSLAQLYALHPYRVRRQRNSTLVLYAAFGRVTMR